MSNLETRPVEQVCHAGDRPAVEILTPRVVPLGGTRAMDVRRTLPQRSRSLVGAWCFLDHYGPDDVTTGPGMQVPPHPHTGLQTVTWLFAGEVLHRDSVGSLQMVRPGQLNLMTAGRGISHSEETPARTTEPLLHGVQLWVALPGSALEAAPAFEHHEDLPRLDGPGVVVHVLVGSLALADAGGPGPAVTSPASAYTPLVGAQIDLAAGARVELVVEPGFEHALLVDAGAVTAGPAPEGVAVPRDHLLYVAPGPDRIVVEAAPGGGDARLVLIGGAPFDEDVVMWWNFVGRTHEDVARARADWAAEVELTSGAGPNRGGTRYAPGAAQGRYGEVHGYDGGPLPAPALPDVQLRPRRRQP